MAKLTIDVKKDKCLGYIVYRGCIQAKKLWPALWIDFHDEELNPWGYQRPFDSDRSQKAADYANSGDKVFWPESILSIRDNSEVDDDEDRVSYKFIEHDKGSDFGKLVVEFNETRTENIGGVIVPWRRAFSQVDCQHRLGHMSDSDTYVTICIIPGIERLEEAQIFKIINDKQKKISTSLVDAIVLIGTTNPVDAPDIHWAYNLGIDVGSSFYKHVSSEGRNISGQKHLVTLRTLRNCCASIVGNKRGIENYVGTLDSYNEVYIFIRNYWNIIKEMWPREFKDNTNYKLMSVPGLKGLSRFGRGICQKSLDEGDTTKRFIRKFFSPSRGSINWSNSGPFRDATGNAGARVVFEGLLRKYGNPYK
jgi:DGQHR domain-containing protein